MKVVRVAATSLNQIPLNWKHNINNIIEAIEEASNNGVNILCLPELCITGYSCEDFFHSQEVVAKARKYLDEIIHETYNMVVSVGLPILHKGAIYNCSAVVVNQKLLGYVAKRNLAGDGNHYEPRYFHAWPNGIMGTTEDGIPIGDIHFNINGVKIGQEICEDAWVGNRPGVALAAEGIDVILNPSASHFAFDKIHTRDRFVLEGSRAFNCVYVYANLLGNEAGRMIYDGDTIIASGGEIVSSGETLSYKNNIMSIATIDIDTNRTNRARTASYKSNTANSSLCIKFDGPDCLMKTGKQFFNTSITKQVLSKNQQFTNSVGLGLFDYLRKSKSQGFVISLSGGADSATIAFLIYFMVKNSISELGFKEFQNKLNHIKNITEIDENQIDNRSELIKVVVGKLLTCVYQASDNSSTITYDAAKCVANSIGATFHSINISSLIKDYTNKVEETLNKKLNWQDDDITLQNIQARVRSPSIWMYANIEHKLLLTTSNRSEAAVGYFTQDGDSSGCLAPISGVDKAFIRSWLKELSDRKITNTELHEAFLAITNQEPTAELRQTKQTDEDDLMPYDMLDLIECLAIRDKKVPLEIFKTIQINKKFINKHKLGGWIDKFFKMWCRNQWKRERMAVSFQLDQTNLDPKSWCRFPVLNSGFEEELQEMWDYIKC